MIVKICGVRSVDDARVAVDAGAQWLGLNFHPPSPRAIDLGLAQRITAAVPEAQIVAVVVNLSRAAVGDIVDAVQPMALQFHGDEDPAYCRGWPCRTIKALRVGPGDDVVGRAAAYDTDWVLVDAFRPGVPGGTGIPIDLDLLRDVPTDRLIVAGGLTPESVGSVVARVRPFGVDVASGVEAQPGVKDHAKVREFVRRALSA